MFGACAQPPLRICMGEFEEGMYRDVQRGGKSLMSVLRIVALIVEALLGLLIAYAAYTLFAWTPPTITKARDALRYPRWFWVLAGIVAAIGAIGLFAGLAFPVVAAGAAIWMVAYFVVATFAHVVRKDFANLGMPLFFLAIAAGLVALQWTNVTTILALIGLR